MEKILEFDSMEKVISIFGEYDKNINIISREFDVVIINRGAAIKISGLDSNVLMAERVIAHLVKLLDKQAFDRSGLIYGMGHAVYSLSDPRAEILHKYAQKLSAEKGLEEDFALYETVARLAPEIIAEKRRMYKGVSANVDFYSGMVYRMLGLPEELFTPIFAVSRIAGWSAHRLEEIQNAGKIIRPAYTNVKKEIAYLPIGERK